MPRPAAAEERSGARRAKRWRERPPRPKAKRQRQPKATARRQRPPRAAAKPQYPPRAAAKRQHPLRATAKGQHPQSATAKRQHLRKAAGLRARPKKPPRLPRRRNSGATISFVVRGLDPRIHEKDESAYTMACRVKPGNDDQRLRQLRFAQARLGARVGRIAQAEDAPRVVVEKLLLVRGGQVDLREQFQRGRRIPAGIVGPVHHVVDAV